MFPSPCAVPCTVDRVTVTLLSIMPLRMAHTVCDPLPSPTLYKVWFNPTVTCEPET